MKPTKNILGYALVIFTTLITACAPTAEIPTGNQIDDQGKLVLPPIVTAVARSSNEVELIVVGTISSQLAIERREMSAGFSSLTSLPIGINQYLDTTVAAEKSYEYRARHIGKNESDVLSEWSLPTSVVLPKAPIQIPDKPGVLVAKAISDVSIEVTLPSYEPKAQSRKLEITNVNTQVKQNVNLPITTALYLILNGKDAVTLAAQTMYSLRLYHVNAMGESLPSDAVTVTTLAPPLMPAPAPTNVVAQIMASNQVRLTWAIQFNQTDAPMTYDFQRRREGGDFTNININQLNMDGKFAIDVLTPEFNVNYRYRVRARNNAGASAYVESNDVKFAPPAPVKPMTPVGLLAQKIPGKFDVQLTWTAQSDKTSIASMRVYRRLDSVPTYALHTSVSSYGLEYHIDNQSVSASTKYCYQISVVNLSNVESDRSNESCATTDSVAINPPTDLIVSQNATATLANAKWTAAAGSTSMSYELWKCIKAVCDAPIGNSLTVIQSTWTMVPRTAVALEENVDISNLAAGDKYGFAVRSKAVSGGATIYSIFSNIVYKTRELNPTITSLVQTAPQSAKIQWVMNSSTPPLQIDIYRCVGNICNLSNNEILQNGTRVSIVSGSAVEYTDDLSAVTAGQVFGYVIRGRSGTIFTNPSAKVTMTKGSLAAAIQQQVVQQSNTAAEVKWSAGVSSVQPQFYDIYRCLGIECSTPFETTTPVIASVPASQLTFADNISMIGVGQTVGYAIIGRSGTVKSPVSNKSTFAKVNIDTSAQF